MSNPPVVQTATIPGQHPEAHLTSPKQAIFRIGFGIGFGIYAIGIGAAHPCTGTPMLKNYLIVIGSVLLTHTALSFIRFIRTKQIQLNNFLQLAFTLFFLSWGLIYGFWLVFQQFELNVLSESCSCSTNLDQYACDVYLYRTTFVLVSLSILAVILWLHSFVRQIWKRLYPKHVLTASNGQPKQDEDSYSQQQPTDVTIQQQQQAQPPIVQQQSNSQPDTSTQV